MDTRMKEYARLVVEVGLNVQKGQTVVLRSPIQCAEFTRLCAEAAYDAGCHEVITDYSDEVLTRLKYLRGDSAIFDECPPWYADKLNSLARGRAAFLSIHADDPDMLKGVDTDRLRRAQQATGKAVQEYQNAMMTNQARWCVISVPITSWATKVFPDGSAQEAIDAMWEAIYTTMRITGDGKAVDRWHEHTQQMLTRGEQLNAMNLETLHYTNSLGTDLYIGLPDNAIWVGGAEGDEDGVPFVANMPTEEIFTAPHRDRVNGKVVSSMPFVLNGNVIRQFAFIFKDGRITDIEAQSEAEGEILRNAISVDEGASYLGEVALVPYDSPISNLGILFYNTLFDENASCHLAFGKAYPCLLDAGLLDAEGLKARGINDSFAHNDFMIGTKDLRITGATRDGRTVDIFTDGNFAF